MEIIFLKLVKIWNRLRKILRHSNQMENATHDLSRIGWCLVFNSLEKWNQQKIWLQHGCWFLITILTCVACAAAKVETLFIVWKFYIRKKLLQFLEHNKGAGRTARLSINWWNNNWLCRIVYAIYALYPNNDIGLIPKKDKMFG